ncbi:hypothetical protein DUI87_01573 [Hirundo rustica rustica]|uniref:Retroviral nucleocapsid Gag protein p24 C-terminal domain-containing protein n=1 Tax=Hirundo rustica rustica TaxID=333673 RepID=A0A3M0L6I2_HIRRU|nr:hypothetical protein DUI87_01573 [Hirundo rustica rustica]
MDFTELKLWEAAWRQLLREALPSLLTDPETAIDENGNALTLEHLMGEGRWTDPTDQASGIPIKALMVIRKHSVTAFFGMVPDGPVIPYYKIIQGTKEAFTKFVERLTLAIEVQVAEVAAREGILREMVFANANNLCRNAILSLPLDPPLTIQDMLRVCQLKVPFMQGYDQDTKQRTPRVAAISGTQQEHIRRPTAVQTKAERTFADGEDDEAAEEDQDMSITDDDIIHITASESIPIQKAETLEFSRQASSFLLSKDFMRQFFWQFSKAASKFQHNPMSSFSRIFLPRKSVAEKSSDAQQSLVPVLQKKEKETKQDKVKPQKQVDPRKDEAAAKLQTQQSIPVSDKTQVPSAREFLATDWTEIRKHALKGRHF